ncbi:hypothetical protein DMH02_011905 [Streptomyces sp. WAC 00631]|nr:hypothetical protein [Streptomyces sp. WAC 00631]
MANDLRLPPCPARLPFPVRHFGVRPSAAPVAGKRPGAPARRRALTFAPHGVAVEGGPLPGASVACVYWSEATAEGPVNGRTVAVRLGGYAAPTRRLALRWLRAQAHRIADGLDPDPAEPWAGEGVLCPVPERYADAPAELRRWAADELRQQAAALRLAEGLPFRLTAADHTGRYSLLARPVAVTALPRVAAAPGRGAA